MFLHNSLWFYHPILCRFCKLMLFSIFLWIESIIMITWWWCNWISRYGICDWYDYNLWFFDMEFLIYLHMKLCRIFVKFFGVSLFLNIMISYKSSFFRQVLILMYVLRVLRWCSRKSMPTQRHATVVTYSTSGSGVTD